MIRLILLLVTLLASANTISSCRCLADTKTQFHNHEEVFVARITNFRPKSETPIHGEETPFTIDLTILEILKGKPPSTVTAEASHIWNDPEESIEYVSTGGADIAIGTEYILFRSTGQVPVIHCCSLKNINDSDQINLLRELRSETNDV